MIAAPSRNPLARDLSSPRRDRGRIRAQRPGRLPRLYRERLRRFRYGPGAFKLDWALGAPIPWTAPEPRRAGTVHLGGTLEEIALAEREVACGREPERPYVLVARQSCSTTRARRRPPRRLGLLPRAQRLGGGHDRAHRGAGRALCSRLPRARAGAPRDGAREIERHDPNHVGGDINAGSQDVRQLFTRPAARAVPYATPLPGLYICSSSTPPGGGVHGMCGAFAAHAAPRRSPGRSV